MEENIKPDIIQYKTKGTCCQMMFIAVVDNIIVDAEFVGGCHGNLQAVKALIKGAPIEEIIKRLEGIKCGDKPTSCPDQLSIALKNYIAEKTQCNTK